MKDQRGGVEILQYSFFSFGARWERVVYATHQPLYSRETDPVPIIQEAGWGPGSVWKGAKNLAPIGIRSPECPVRSEPLYRLGYLDPIPLYWHSAARSHLSPHNAFNSAAAVIKLTIR
jgi:hypothetical protein